jgi:hypothetical protein
MSCVLLVRGYFDKLSGNSLVAALSAEARYRHPPILPLVRCYFMSCDTRTFLALARSFFFFLFFFVRTM